MPKKALFVVTVPHVCNHASTTHQTRAQICTIDRAGVGLSNAHSFAPLRSKLNALDRKQNYFENFRKKKKKNFKKSEKMKSPSSVAAADVISASHRTHQYLPFATLPDERCSKLIALERVKNPHSTGFTHFHNLPQLYLDTQRVWQYRIPFAWSQLTLPTTLRLKHTQSDRDTARYRYTRVPLDEMTFRPKFY